MRGLDAPTFNYSSVVGFLGFRDMSAALCELRSTETDSASVPTIALTKVLTNHADCSDEKAAPIRIDDSRASGIGVAS
jgi:hypothetical protein